MFAQGVLVLVLLMTVQASADVPGLQCVIKNPNWLHPDYLKLSWDLDDNAPTNESMTEYKVNITWCGWMSCGTCTQPTLTSCVFSYMDPQSMSFSYNFSLTAEVSRNGTEFFKRVWDVDPNYCYQPPPLSSVTASPVSSSCVNVAWQYGAYCEEFDFYYKTFYFLQRQNGISNWTASSIRYPIANESSENISNTVPTVQSTVPTYNCSGIVMVCGLKPYTTYDFTVQCRKTSNDDVPIGVLSEIIQISTVRTLEDVPTGSAEITDGGFMFFNGTCPRGNTNVKLYWKDIPEYLKHGVITHFYIRSNELSQHGSRSPIMTVVPGNVSQCHLTLKCNTEYNVETWAETTAGQSTNISATNIDTSFSESAIDTVIPEVLAQGFNVYWTIRNGITVQHKATVFWCIKDIHEICTSPMSWIPAPEDATHASIIIQDSSLPLHHFKVGVSAGQGGIKWSPCQYLGKNISDGPSGLALGQTDDVLPGSLLIKWDNTACESQAPAPYIAEFVIEACEVEKKFDHICKDSPVKCTVDREASSFTVNDLLPSSTYKVAMRIRDRHGQLSNPSIVFGDTAAEYSLVEKSWFVALLVIIGLVIILAIAGIMFCIRWGTKYCKRYVEVRRHIQNILPTTPADIDDLIIEEEDFV